MSNIILVYNTENLLRHAVSVTYWATKERQQHWFLQKKSHFDGYRIHRAHNQSGQEAAWGGGGGVGGSEPGGAAGRITQRGAWTWRPYLLRINTTLREFRASEQVQLRAGERRRMCCTSDLGDSEGARRRKTSSLHFHACIYYSPKARQWGQRRNEQASSSTRKVIGWSPGVNVSFIILTPDPWPQTFRGHGFHFKQFASLRRARPAQLFML